VVVVVREVTDHRERERRLRERRDELERLGRVTAAIDGVLAALAGATTVDGIERAVRERLVDTDLYDVAYVVRGSARTDVEAVTAAAPPEGLEAAVVDDGTGRTATPGADRTTRPTGGSERKPYNSA